MFKDLKEYQDITRIYNESVNISEEQRAINKLFQEEDFTLEELDYIEENFDELWEEYFQPEILAELCEDVEHVQTLTEENLNEVLLLKTFAKGALKASRGLRKANIGIVKGARKLAKAGKTAAKDTMSGIAGIGKKIAPFAGKVAKTIGKGALLGTGALIPFSIANSLRKKGKAERLKGAAAGAGVGAAGAAAIKGASDKGGSKVGDAASAGAAAVKKMTDAGTAGSQGAKNVSRNINIYLGSAGKKGGDLGKVGASSIKTMQTKLDASKATTKETPKMSSIEKKNRARLGDEKVDKLKSKQVDFKAMRKGNMSKSDFIAKYPNSITAQKSKGLRDHTEWDSYDLVLEYLHSTGQVDSIEEANYVMIEMDGQTINEISNEVREILDENFKERLQNLGSNIKKKVTNVVDKVKEKGSEVVSNLKNKVDVAKKTYNPASKENKKIREKQAIQKDDSATTKEKQVAKSQESAYKRQRSNKSIADVKAENKAKMIAAAKERNKKFKADQKK
tara:strand:- start:276 stop:1796 length:1521 start_codon:yes stop_codon:yes gene_type:complete